MLAAHAGCRAEVAAVTERGDARRARLRGVAARAGRAARRARRVAPSTRCTTSSCSPRAPARWSARCKRLGYRFAIVSGGFTPDHRPARRATSASTSPRANELEVVDGRLTGRIVGDGRRPGRQGRRAAPVRRRGRRAAEARPSRSATAPTTSTCSPPPGSASPSTPSRWCSEAADTAVNVPYLDAIMYLLGITREEVEAADAADGPHHPGSPRRSEEPRSAAADVEGRRRWPVSAPRSAQGTRHLEHRQRRRAGSPGAGR